MTISNTVVNKILGRTKKDKYSKNKERYFCNECDFEAESKHYLNEHKKVAHQKYRYRLLRR